MPNIRSQRVDDTGVEIIASDGRTFSITVAVLLTHFQGESGGAAARKTRTIAWLKSQIETALGADQVPAVGIDFDFSTATGRPLNLRAR